MPYIAANDPYRLIVDYDDDPDHPYEANDTLGTIAHWHRRMRLGGSKGILLPSDYASGEEAFEATIGVIGRDVLAFPLYFYDHSVQSISMASFTGRAHHANWNSGPVGYVYATKAAVREWFTVRRITAAIRTRAEAVLRAEVEQYDAYLRNDVYDFLLECRTTDADTEDSEWIEVDQGYGFYGTDWTTNGLLDTLPSDAQSLVANLQWVSS